jgi:hypothetical protein
MAVHARQEQAAHAFDSSQRRLQLCKAQSQINGNHFKASVQLPHLDMSRNMSPIITTAKR